MPTTRSTVAVSAVSSAISRWSAARRSSPGSTPPLGGARLRRLAGDGGGSARPRPGGRRRAGSRSGPPCHHQSSVPVDMTISVSGDINSGGRAGGECRTSPVRATSITVITPAWTGSVTTRSASSGTVPAMFSEMTMIPCARISRTAVATSPPVIEPRPSPTQPRAADGQRLGPPRPARLPPPGGSCRQRCARRECYAGLLRRRPPERPGPPGPLRQSQ